MTPEEYTRRKVEIVKRYTGETLVPDDQITDIPVTEHMIDAMKSYIVAQNKGHAMSTLDGDICVYCSKYYNVDLNTCNGCPMFEAGNDCGDNGSSYDICTDALEAIDESGLIKELIELTQEFIKANKHFNGS